MSHEMKALSIMQPWAWLIVNGHKDIENRTWRTAMRGRIFVHAGKFYPAWMHKGYAEEILKIYGIKLPPHKELTGLTGGLVGQVDIIDCVREHPSKWKDEDSWGFVLANPQPMEFRPLRGQLGFFDVR